MRFFLLKMPRNVPLWKLGLLVIICVMFWGVYYTLFSPCVLLPQNAPPREVIIEPGWSLMKVADRLVDEDVIVDRRSFLFWARIFGLEKRIKAGRYRFEGGLKTYQVLGRLKKGGETTSRQTIPEGLTVANVARLIYGDDAEKEERFLTLAADSTHVFLEPEPETGLEGYLFPDTYNFRWDLDPKSVIEMMVEHFDRIYSEEFQRRATALDFTRHQVLVLASIIEREARNPEERPRISAVFHNRLRRRMLLQADPTVRYALGEWKRPLWTRDLEIDSPYNTYLYGGLPPGPICNPGEDAIRAALWPLEGCEDLYFVARRNGSHSHIFSRTASDHNRARQMVKLEGDRS